MRHATWDTLNSETIVTVFSHAANCMCVYVCIYVEVRVDVWNTLLYLKNSIWEHRSLRTTAELKSHAAQITCVCIYVNICTCTCRRMRHSIWDTLYENTKHSAHHRWIRITRCTNCMCVYTNKYIGRWTRRCMKHSIWDTLYENTEHSAHHRWIHITRCTNCMCV